MLIQILFNFVTNAQLENSKREERGGKIKDKPNPKEPEEKNVVAVLPNAEYARLNIDGVEIELASALKTAEELNQIAFNTYWLAKHKGKPQPQYTG